ncbi:unnamed protein product [Didymodactylos carnosus]|uniref:Uncharacterized protein n=1 Tax=Didymodactylos carnosus TaxID=1234261 RepID=A0A815UIY6_9BILA|nr:unnamed protein product [Didymodactylos carnosus]CAF1518278.1 unnamed protein product [Didymodactylos carnosus]CAF4176420.1 unnamed protein product [Didymodactylos carnosus]CAF4377946.1 unnamed protein product [Didymodactylos carnosus]
MQNGVENKNSKAQLQPPKILTPTPPKKSSTPELELPSPAPANDFNEELDEIRMADNDQVSDECIVDSSDDLEDDEYAPSTEEQSTVDESDTFSISSSIIDEEDNLTQSQQERQV